MFGAAARIAARPAVAAAAAAASVTATQGPAHARAPPGAGQSAARQAAHPPAHSSKLVDRDTEGWVLAELQDEMVLFQPFDGKEVDEAASTVMAMWSGRAGPSAAGAGAYPIVTEPGDDAADGADGGCGSSASSTSDGCLADAVIEAAAAASAEAVSAGRRQEREQLESLMAITTRMLRRPGMQREVVMCMLEDQEVRQLMLRQCSDLDRYLLAAGIHNPQLLTAAEEGAAGATSFASSAAAGAPHESGSSRAHEASRDDTDGPSLIDKLVGAVGGAVAGALEKAGDALAFLGGWLRRHFAPFIVGPSDHEAGWGQEEAEAEGLVADGEAAGGSGGSGGGGGRKRAPKRGADVVLGGVMALAVAVFCVAIIRKPLVLRSLSRR